MIAEFFKKLIKIFILIFFLFSIFGPFNEFLKRNFWGKEKKSTMVGADYLITVIATAYYEPLKKQKKFFRGSYKKEVRMNGRGKKTFSGKKPQIGMIAADPRVLPMGTVLKIPGYGWGVVEDKGLRIKGKRIDLFMGSGERGLKKALAWGKKSVIIKILKMG